MLALDWLSNVPVTPVFRTMALVIVPATPDCSVELPVNVAVPVPRAAVLESESTPALISVPPE